MRGILLMCMVLLLCAGLTAQAQSLPTIELFTVAGGPISYPAVEAGEAAADFSWRAVGLRDGDRMQLHALVGGAWVLIGEDFAPEKTDRLVIAHPLDFIPPTYRLSVVDAAGSIVAEQILELSYAPPDGPPTIAMFLPFPSGYTVVVPETAFDAPLPVQWQVDNRSFNSSLVFEQVLPGGTARSAELPRPVEWLPAHSTGSLHVIDPGAYQDVVLRLRVIDRADGRTLAQQDLVLHVENSALPAAELVSFEVTPDAADPGGAITVSWEVTGTDAVFIEYFDGLPNGTCAGDLETVYGDLPTSGALTVMAPELSYGGVSFRLFADYYVPGDRHHCGSYQDPLAEVGVPLMDYIGQGVQSFTVAPGITTVGATVTLSWAVSEGQSVTIIQPDTDDVLPGWGELPPAYAIYSDLPLSGTLSVTIPDDPTARAAHGRYFLLYIIEEDGTLPGHHDWNAHVVLDIDGHLDCETRLQAGEGQRTLPPGAAVTVTWDNCGYEESVLRYAFSAGDNGQQPVRETVETVGSAGTTRITLPDEAGVFLIQLSYVYQGQRYFLRAARLTLRR